MKLHLLLLSLLIAGLASGREITLSSTDEHLIPNEHWGDRQRIVLHWDVQNEATLDWQSSAEGKDIPLHNHKYRLVASRNLHPEREELRYWSVSFAWGEKRAPNWFQAPRISRVEFLEIIRRSVKELRKKDPEFHFDKLYVGYHLIAEHEAEIAPKFREIFATTQGEVRMKHRGIMNQLYDAINRSKEIDTTRKELGKLEIRFTSHRMAGDYYTPVNRKLASTWNAAAKLDGFGLKTPPVILFFPAAEEK